VRKRDSERGWDCWIGNYQRGQIAFKGPAPSESSLKFKFARLIALVRACCDLALEPRMYSGAARAVGDTQMIYETGLPLCRSEHNFRSGVAQFKSLGG